MSITKEEFRKMKADLDKEFKKTMADLDRALAGSDGKERSEAEFREWVDESIVGLMRIFYQIDYDVRLAMLETGKSNGGLEGLLKSMVDQIHDLEAKVETLQSWNFVQYKKFFGKEGQPFPEKFTEELMDNMKITNPSLREGLVKLQATM